MGPVDRGLAVAEVGEQVVAEGPLGRVVPPVVPLQRVVDEVVELAFGAVVDGARPVRRADPPVAGDGAQVHVDAEQVQLVERCADVSGVPLAEFIIEVSTRCRVERGPSSKALGDMHRCVDGRSGKRQGDDEAEAGEEG